MDEIDNLMMSILSYTDPLSPTEMTEILNIGGIKIGHQRVRHKLDSLCRYQFLEKTPFTRVLGGIVHRGYLYNVIGE